MLYIIFFYRALKNAQAKPKPTTSAAAAAAQAEVSAILSLMLCHANRLIFYNRVLRNKLPVSLKAFSKLSIHLLLLHSYLYYKTPLFNDILFNLHVVVIAF